MERNDVIKVIDWNASDHKDHHRLYIACFSPKSPSSKSSLKHKNKNIFGDRSENKTPLPIANIYTIRNIQKSLDQVVYLFRRSCSRTGNIASYDIKIGPQLVLCIILPLPQVWAEPSRLFIRSVNGKKMPP